MIQDCHATEVAPRIILFQRTRILHLSFVFQGNMQGTLAIAPENDDVLALFAIGHICSKSSRLELQLVPAQRKTS